MEWVHTVDDLRNDILGYTEYVNTYHQSLFVSLRIPPLKRNRIEKRTYLRLNRRRAVLGLSLYLGLYHRVSYSHQLFISSTLFYTPNPSFLVFDVSEDLNGRYLRIAEIRLTRHQLQYPSFRYILNTLHYTRKSPYSSKPNFPLSQHFPIFLLR